MRPESDRVLEAKQVMSNDNINEHDGDSEPMDPTEPETLATEDDESTEAVPADGDATSVETDEAHTDGGEEVATAGSEVVAKDTAANEVVAATTREAVRAKAQQVATKQARTRVAQRSVIGIIVVAIVVATVAVVWSIVSAASSKADLNPAGLQNDGFVITKSGASFVSSAGNGTLGDATPSASPDAGATPDPAPTTKLVEIRVYVDFLDPQSATFIKANAKQLTKLVRDDSISLSIHPVATLTSNSDGTKYPQRAAAALACVASYSPDSIFAFTYELFDQQPELNTGGYTDDELADMAIAVGSKSPDGVRSCIEKAAYTKWVTGATDTAVNQNLPGTKNPLLATPTVLVNDVKYVGALDNPAEFLQSVMAGESDAYYNTPTPEPTPEPTATPTGEATPEPTATSTAG